MSRRRIRIGIVGCGYGRQVLVPAFRNDARAAIVAIAATNQMKAETCAQELGIEEGFGDWRLMLDRRRIDAAAIATPPAAQAEIVATALAMGLPVFAEKPLALDVNQAMSLVETTGPLANVIDFNFCDIDAFRAAREALLDGNVGRLRHVCVTWQVESYANRVGLATWKTDNSAGGGALLNFVSHSLDYLEWFVGPIQGLSAHLAGMPNDARRNDSFVAMALRFGCGAAGSLTMSAAAYQGSGHRIEFYGEDGTIVLNNTGPDYMRGFSLTAARRPEQALTPVEVQTPNRDRWADGRVLPSSRVAKRFLDWVEGGLAAEPSFARGLRAQYLADAARRSHTVGRWIDIPAVLRG